MRARVPQPSDDPLRALLREALRESAQGKPGALGGISSVQFRAGVTLYTLLRDHPIDPWGRCRSCRRPGTVFGWRWRSCHVHITADRCLRQFDEVLLLGLLSRE